jgi:hypothetical protein
LSNNGNGNSPYYVNNYVVEFTPYDTIYGTQQATKTALFDKKDY